MKPTVAIINGSLGGAHGNTAATLQRLIARLESYCELPHLDLSARPEWNRTRALIERSDGFVFATGTYWDSWGSPLQEFFETATELETSDSWLGKPAAVVVTMHSVGGKSVLSRLQGVLSSMGLMIPPMTGLTYSLSNHLALRGPESDHRDDLWHLPDLEVVADNLMCALSLKQNWRSWGVDQRDPMRLWLS